MISTANAESEWACGAAKLVGLEAIGQMSRPAIAILSRLSSAPRLKPRIAAACQTSSIGIQCEPYANMLVPVVKFGVEHLIVLSAGRSKVAPGRLVLRRSV